jgi:hypothetical protein
MPLAPAGYSVDLIPGDFGATLAGRRILYWWPSDRRDDWQLGTFARNCAPSASSSTRVVACTRQTLALRGTKDTLLTVTLLPTGSAGCCSAPLAPTGFERASQRNLELASEARPHD